MTLPEVKQFLTDNQNIDKMLIFKCEDTDFVGMQYTKKLAEIRNAEIVNIEALEDIPPANPFIEEKIIYLYKCDNLDELIEENKDLIIITKKLSKDVLKQLSDNIVIVPKLESWMTEDYIKLICPGLTPEIVAWFVANYDNDIYKVLLEVNKLTLFPPDTRKYMFEEFYNNNVFESSNKNNAFRLSNALQGKNKAELVSILSDINGTDSMAVLSLVQNNLKKLCKVWLNKAPNSDNTGLKSNQIWAINNLPRTYTKEQLTKAFEIVSGLDRKIKSGEFPIELTTDYIVVKLMSGVQ